MRHSVRVRVYMCKDVYVMHIYMLYVRMLVSVSVRYVRAYIYV